MMLKSVRVSRQNLAKLLIPLLGGAVIDRIGRLAWQLAFCGFRGPGMSNIGTLMIRIRFGVYYTIIIIRNPQNPILTIKAPILNYLGAP